MSAPHCLKYTDAPGGGTNQTTQKDMYFLTRPRLAQLKIYYMPLASARIGNRASENNKKGWSIWGRRNRTQAKKHFDGLKNSWTTRDHSNEKNSGVMVLLHSLSLYLSHYLMKEVERNSVRNVRKKLSLQST